MKLSQFYAVGMRMQNGIFFKCFALMMTKSVRLKCVCVPNQSIMQSVILAVSYNQSKSQRHLKFMQIMTAKYTSRIYLYL